MATLIDSLYISLGLDSSEAESNLSRFATNFEQSSQKIEQSANKTAGGLNNLLMTVGRLAAPYLGAFSMGALIKQYTGQIDGLSRMSKAYNTNIEDLQTWINAIDGAGYNSSMFQMSLRRLERQLIGTGKTAFELFEEMGEAAGTAKFDELAKQFSLDPATMAFLKNEGGNLQSLLADERSKIYTKEDEQLTRKYINAIDDLQDEWNMLAAIFVRTALPAVTKIFNGIEKFFKYIRQHEAFIKAFAVGLAVVITKMLLPAFLSLAAGILTAFAPFLPLLLLLTGVAALVDDFITYVQGGESALGDFWAIFGTGEQIARRLADTWQELKLIGMDLWDSVKARAASFIGYFKPALQMLGFLFTEVLQLIKNLFVGDFEDIAASVQQVIAGIVLFMKEVFFAAFRLIGDAFSGVVKKVASFLPNWALPKSLESGATNAAAAVSGTAASAAVANGGATTNNSSNTQVQVQKIEINAPNSDPKAIANSTGNEIRRLANTGNKGVKQ